MAAILNEESTITSKGQTTIPKAVRKALGVNYGGRVTFRVDERRRVYVEKAAEENSDPVIGHFLEFLAIDMQKHPGSALVPLTTSLRDRIADLVDGVAVDLDADIDGDVAI